MTFADIANALSITILAIKENMLLPALVIAFLWCINIVNWMNHKFLRALGVYPRHWVGIPGIFFSAFIHADADHLFFNSVPLFILMAFLLALVGQNHFIQISVEIIIVSGILTWLVGRKAIHVGASGVIMGYWAFILAYTWHHPSLSAVIMSAIMLYYLAGLALSLLPTSERVSWEGHCCGAAAGIIVAYFL
jgi:membrane associated rhomboid family serine protease